MKTIQRIIPIIALVVLTILIIGGVFFINKSKESDKALLVPANANSVFYLKPEQIANDFYQLLKRNPTYLDSVSSTQIDVKEIKKKSGGNGLNPLVDLIAYTFYDTISNSQNIAVILSVINEQNFIASLTKTPETIQRNDYATGEIIILEKEHLILIKDNSETILLQSLDKETIISELTAQQQFDAVFGKTPNSLAKTNKSFLSFIQSDKHAGIWAAENNNILIKFSSLFSILDDFSDKQFNFKANEEHVDIQSIIKLKQTDLSVQYHVLAPDYPGFGRSEQPLIKDFDYTFDNMSNIVDGFLKELNVKKYSIYLMDYGAPVGFRIASKYPERVESLIIQNGNAYDEGLKDFWIPIKKYWNDYTVENGKPLEGFHSPAGLIIFFSGSATCIA